MKKTACLLIVLLLFSLSVTVSAEKETWDQYIEWEYDTIYDAYSGGYDEGKAYGYDEGYDEGTRDIEKAKGRSYSSGKRDGISETEEEYQGFAPWWTNIVTGLGVLAICVCVFSIIRKRDKNLSDSPALTRAERKLKKQEQKVSKQKEIVEQKRNAP